MTGARGLRLGAWMLRVGWALAALFALHSLVGVGGEVGDTVFRLWVYHLALAIAALVVALRAVRVPRERGAWALFAAGLISWTVADLYYSAVLVDREVVSPPC